ncbi:fibronectin-binding autotransporter adhesin [Hymenobacter sp. UYAg731]
MGQTLYTFNGGGTSGDWDATYSWTTDPTGSTSINARVPGNNDNVVITNSFVLSVRNPVAATGLNVTVQKGGVLNLVNATNQLPSLASLGGQGTLRIAGPYFPTVGTNNFDDANTGTVEFYDWAAGTSALPIPGSGLYNNLRFLNTKAVAYGVSLNSDLTLNGSLVMLRTNAATFPAPTPVSKTPASAITFNLGNNATTRTLNVLGDITLGVGNTMGATASTTTHTLNAYGSLTNNGVMKFFTATEAVLLNFTGTTDANFACNGPTDLGALQVDKGVDSQVLLNVTSSNDVLGTIFGNLRLNSTVAGDILILKNGITKLGNNVYLSKIHNGKSTPNLAYSNGWFELGSSLTSPTLWVAGATVVNDNASLFVIYGILRISAGKLTSDNNDGGMVIREDAQLLIEGSGSQLIVNKFRPSSTATTHRGSFTMTGGLMQVTGKVLASSFDDQFARFAIPYTTQAFRMSGGTIEVYNPNGSGDGFFHVGVNINNASITGGTIKLFLPNTANNGTILSTAPLWNLSITKPTAGGSSKALLSAMTVVFAGETTTIQPLTVLNNFNIDGANAATFDAAGQDITIQGTLKVGPNGTYLPGNNTTIFSGLKDQQLVNNGLIGATAGRATFNNWTIDKAAGTLTLGGAYNYYVPATAKLNILNGVLNDGGLVINVLGDMYNSASHTGNGSITMAGSALQTIGGDGTGVFGNLTIDNTMGSGTTTAGVVAVKLAANISVASTLNMNSLHIFSIGANRLSLTNVVPSDALTAPGGSFGTQRFIQTAGNQSDLGLQRTYGSNSSVIFPVGTGTKYTPATISLNSATNNGKYGQVSVSPTDKRNPFLSGSNNAFSYYWKVRSIGFTPGSIPANGITATFTARLSDALNTTNGTTTGYIPGYYTPSTTSWKATGTTSLVTSSNPTSDIAFRTGAALSQFDGEFTAGVSAAFGPVTVYYSRGSGDWETPGTWSTDPTLKFTGAAATVKPGPGNPVVIGLAGTYNHVVTVKQNTATAGSLIIDTGSTLDVGATTSHNFGALPDGKASGLGRLRITSATTSAPTFPGGDFGSFLLPGGGTVEYYTSGFDFTLPTISTSLSLGSYCNLLLSPANGALITLPNVDLRIFDSMTSGISTGTTGTASLNGAAARTLRIDNLLAVKYGKLRFANGTAQTLQLNQDMQVDAGATFDASGGGATTTANAITITGSVTNNGTLNFGQTSKVNLTFTGTSTSNITGTNAGANTTLYTLTLNKGIGRAALLNLDVAGTLTTPTSGWLTLNNGTLRYAKATGTLTVHDAATTYLITDNAGLTVDAATAKVTIATANNAASDLKLAGEINVLQGTLNVGDPAIAAGNDLEYASAGAPTLRVGNNNPTSTATLNVNGQIRRTINNLDGSLRYDQSGGITDIKGLGASATYNNERGLFEVQGVGSIFRMSDGFLNLHRSNLKSPVTTADLYLAPDSTVVTGGAVVLGNTAAAVGSVTLTVNSAVPLYNLIVEGVSSGTNTNTGKQVGTGALSLKGSLTIRNVSSFFNANGLPLNIDQDLINNNTLANASLTTGGFQPTLATQTTTFTGKGPALQKLVSVAGNLTAFGGLVVNNAQTNGTLQLGGNAQVFGTLALTKGTLDDNGKTITALGDVLNSAVHTSSGSGSLTLGGSVNQTIGGSGLGKFGNLTLNNAAGATSTANQEVTNVLTLSNGVFFIGSNLLLLSNTAVGAVTGTFSTTRCIRTNGIVADLGVQKNFPSGASPAFTFPIGAAVVTKYTPVQMTVTASSSPGSITVQPIDLAHPSTTDPAAKELSYYWKVGSTGLASPTVTQVFTYYDFSAGNDVNGNESLYKLGRFLNGAWVPNGGISTSAVNTTNNTLTNTGVNYIDGDYTGGETSEFGAVPTFYSRNSTAGTAGGANWTDPLAWTSNADGSNPSTVPTTTPTLANPVVIRPGHFIVSNSAGLGAATLKLDGILDLGTYLANNFNTVSGTGTIRIGSAIFPAGNYANFVAANTGTVDFTGAVQLPARDTYNNLTLSGGNAKQLTNLDLTINGLLSVAANTTVDNSTNQSIVLTSGTSGASLNGTLNLNDGTLTTGASLATGSTGRLNLGAGAVAIGTSLANAGTLNMGSGAVTVGTSFTNTGTYKANTGTGSVAVGTTFSNSGTYTGGIGSLNVASDFTNTGTLTTSSGTVNARSTFSNSGTYTATTSNVMHVDGDYTNLSGGSFNASSSNMVLRANFTNRGTFTAGSSLVQFITDANHLINGNTSFFDLQKLGSNALVLGTATDVHVGNLLTMQNGVINTGTNTGNVLYLDNQGFQPIVGNTLTSYVAGRLAITLPNEVGTLRVFPVGAGQRYRPVSINQLGTLSNSPVVLVEIINGKPAGKVDASLSNLSANRYYRIQLKSGTIDQPTVQLSFNNDVVDEEVNVPGNLRVAYTSAPLLGTSTWISTLGSGVFSPDFPRGYTTSGQGTTTIDANSLFTLGSTNAVDNPLSGTAPLPVELVQFSAVRQGTAVQVAWVTASEKNSDYFAVERSANGQFFTEIGRVNGQGSTTARHEYSTLDTAPLGGLSYYRLRQVDLDGKFAYSPVATVRFDGKAAAPSLLAYPNPAAGTGFQLAALNLAGAGGTVRLLDGVGRVVLTQTVAAGTAEITIQPTKVLASGMYIATWTTPEGLKLTTKVAVE